MEKLTEVYTNINEKHHANDAIFQLLSGAYEVDLVFDDQLPVFNPEKLESGVFRIDPKHYEKREVNPEYTDFMTQYGSVIDTPESFKKFVDSGKEIPPKQIIIGENNMVAVRMLKAVQDIYCATCNLDKAAKENE